MRTYLKEELETRLIRVLPRLARLVVRVPEKHDLVLMKTVRGYEHDLQAAEEIHANSPLDLEILVSRFHEMDPTALLCVSAPTF